MFILIAENGSGADLYAGDAAEPGFSFLPSGSFDSSEGCPICLQRNVGRRPGRRVGVMREGLKERCLDADLNGEKQEPSEERG